jgi:hypothetical protein
MLGRRVEKLLVTMQWCILMTNLLHQHTRLPTVKDMGGVLDEGALSVSVIPSQETGSKESPSESSKTRTGTTN